MVNKEKKRIYMQKYHADNRERLLEDMKQRYRDNLEERKAYAKKRSKETYPVNRDKKLAYQKKMWETNQDGYSDRRTSRASERWKNIRMDGFEALGGALCVTCGFDDWRALQIDHINGGGGRHRRTFSNHRTYYGYIKTHTEEFQVLCANCNRIKTHTNQEYRQRKRVEAP